MRLLLCFVESTPCPDSDHNAAHSMMFKPFNGSTSIGLVALFAAAGPSPNSAET